MAIRRSGHKEHKTEGEEQEVWMIRSHRSSTLQGWIWIAWGRDGVEGGAPATPTLTLFGSGVPSPRSDVWCGQKLGGSEEITTKKTKDTKRERRTSADSSCSSWPSVKRIWANHRQLTQRRGDAKKRIRNISRKGFRLKSVLRRGGGVWER